MTKAYSYIRMSTDAQLRGDSLRRQIEKTRQFAKEQGLVLDEAFELKDIGLSAYDGSNVEKGELGKFLTAVRLGQVEKGSYLIVESLDRLSRQRVNQSLRMFLDILDAGIVVATLIDRRIYTAESTEPFELMMSVALMARANDESLHKSERVRSAWSNKRKNGTNKIITARCKAWLKPRSDRSGFDPIPARADIIRRIFVEAADDGMGVHVIAHRLNTEGVGSFTGRSGWHKSYVLKILTDRAVLGEFQPHVVIKGRRQPEGEPFEGYYPAVIDQALFYRAHAALGRRKLAGGGKKGVRVSNLFSKLARCGICGSNMTYVNKGGRGASALICSSARRGMGCYKVGWPYSEFERSFLTFVRELDLSSVTENAATKSELETLRVKMAETEGRLGLASQLRDRLLELVLGDEPTDFLKTKLREQDQTVADLQVALAELKKRCDHARTEVDTFTQSAANISGLIDRLQSQGNDDVYRARSIIATRLQDLIAELQVWPGGTPVNPEAGKIIRQVVRDKYPDGSHDAEQYVAGMTKALRAFWVRFKDNTYKFVAPTLASAERCRMYAASDAPLTLGIEPVAPPPGRLGIGTRAEAISHQDGSSTAL